MIHRTVPAQARGRLLRTSVVSFSRAFAARGTRELEPDEDLMTDGVHFTERGYAIWARELHAALERYL